MAEVVRYTHSISIYYEKGLKVAVVYYVLDEWELGCPGGFEYRYKSQIMLKLFFENDRKIDKWM
tara:strand:- start:176 stop:367 length:192 start_codon:yes stop_codon:yes gene_type:complete